MWRSKISHDSPRCWKKSNDGIHNSGKEGRDDIEAEGGSGAATLDLRDDDCIGGSLEIQSLIDKTVDEKIEKVLADLEKKSSSKDNGNPKDEESLHRVSLLENKVNEIEDTARKEDGRREEIEEEYVLPQSTFTLMITENPLSGPFIFAICATALSLLCLGLTLAENLHKATSKNHFGVPLGVSKTVTAAQFVGIFLGVLFEDEIPEGECMCLVYVY